MSVGSPDLRSDLVVLEPQDQRWLDYACTKPEATLFHHPAWLSVLAESYGYHPFIVTVCDAAGQIVAGLPMMEIRTPVRGRRWVSLPFTDYCPPLSNDPESLERLTEGLVALARSNHVLRVEVRWELPPHPAVHSQVVYYLHRLALGSDPQPVLKGFKRTHRQNISTAEERGVRIEWGTEPEHLRRFYGLQLETRRRKGVPVQPWKFFELIGKRILAKGLGFVLLAHKDDACLAGGLFLHWQRTLTYKYAASSGEEQQCRPNNLLSWTAMRWGCEHGYRVFDLGRTEMENDGLRRFKAGWGAEETPLTYTALPGFSAGSSKLESLVGAVIRKSPPWVCKATGELLYRHFG